MNPTGLDGGIADSEDAGYRNRLGRRGCCSFMKPRSNFKVWHGSLFVVVGVVTTRGSRCIALSV